MIKEHGYLLFVVTLVICFGFVVMPQNHIYASEKKKLLECPVLQNLQQQIHALEMAHNLGLFANKQLIEARKNTIYIAERTAVIDEIYRPEGSIVRPNEPILSVSVNNKQYIVTNLSDMSRKVIIIFGGIGDMIEAGDVLVQLDDSDLMQRLAQVRGLIGYTSQTLQRLRYIEQPRIRWLCEQELLWRNESGA